MIRVKSEINIIDSISSNFGDFVFPRTTTEYKWLAPGSGIPILQIEVQDGGFGGEEVSRIAYQDIEGSVGIHDPEMIVENIGINPNPSNGLVNLKFSLNTATEATIAIFDATGKEVFSVAKSKYQQGQQQKNIDLTGELANGIYQVVICLLYTSDAADE